MSISLVPNLQIVTCVQIAVPILNTPEIRSLIDGCSIYSQRPEIIILSNMIEKVAFDKIQSLVLPHTIQNMVKNCIMFMYSQILDYKDAFWRILRDPVSQAMPYFQFFWKADGTMDQKKTTKALVKNQNIDLKTRFRWACCFCLDDSALNLWKEMTAGGISFTQSELQCMPLVKIWTKVFEDGSPRMEITDEILESIALSQNVCLFRHVFELLPYDKRHLLLLKTATERCFSTDVMTFCLSRLSIYDQQTVFGKKPIKVLQSILTWPNQFVCLKVANQLWKHLSYEEYSDLTEFILSQIFKDGYKYDTLIQLLKEIWFESPINFKEQIKQDILFRPLKVVLTCDMQSFPLDEFDNAYNKYIDELVDLTLTRVIHKISI